MFIYAFRLNYGGACRFFLSHSQQPPNKEDGLMQLHFMARIPSYVPLHMPGHQRHGVQLHEERPRVLGGLVFESC